MKHTKFFGGLLFAIIGIFFLVERSEGSLITAGLVGEWTFEGSNANDSTGLIGNGTTVGTPTYTTGAAPLNRTGTFLNLSPNNYINIANDPDIPSGTEARTIALWLKVDTTANNGGPFRMGQPGSGLRDFSLELDSGTTSLTVNHWTQDLSVSVPAGLSDWRHIAFSYDGSTTRAYVDGSFVSLRNVALNTGTNGIRFGGPRLAVGGSNGGVFSIDDVLVYDRALSASEINILATVPEPSSVMALLGLFGFLAGFRRRRRLAS